MLIIELMTLQKVSCRFSHILWKSVFCFDRKNPRGVLWENLQWNSTKTPTMRLFEKLFLELLTKNVFSFLSYMFHQFKHKINWTYHNNNLFAQLLHSLSWDCAQLSYIFLLNRTTWTIDSCCPDYTDSHRLLHSSRGLTLL